MCHTLTEKVPQSLEKQSLYCGALDVGTLSGITSKYEAHEGISRAHICHINQCHGNSFAALKKKFWCTLYTIYQTTQPVFSPGIFTGGTSYYNL